MNVNARPHMNTSSKSLFVAQSLALSLLGSAVLSALILGPSWFFVWLAGVLGLDWLWFTLGSFLAWTILFVIACSRFAGVMQRRRRKRSALWLTVALSIVLAYILPLVRATPPPHRFFARGLVRHVEISTDIAAIQTWLATVDPNECLPAPGVKRRGQSLGKAKGPESLSRVGAQTQLELDAQGRPAVRLRWVGGKAGKWGLVIGAKDLKTPPSDPASYGEKRTPLRPGVYFWYEEA